MRKLLSKLLLLPLILTSNSFAGNVLIYEDLWSGNPIVSSRQTFAGNTPTVINLSNTGYSNLNPSGLNNYSQVWDLAQKSGDMIAMNSNIISAYTNYLSQGGSLFLMGESDGYPTRNNSIFSFISTLGGGSVSQGSNSNLTDVTILPSFRTANTTSTMQYAFAGTFSSIGNGVCITSDCAAVLYARGTLSAAQRGTLIVVLDVNFVQPDLSSGVYKGQDFTDDIISYFNIYNYRIDTQASLTRQASSLRGVHNIASLISHYPNSATYDCNLFDVKGMCISAGGRYSTVDNPSSNSSAAVVTLGYKVSPNIRIGGFLDQSVTNNNPTGIDISNKNPMMGAFAYWNQNADGLGYQIKVANAYQDKDLTTTRDVIGTSEAGRGNTSLNSRSYVGELSYAFMYKENTLVRPYFAVRHTTIEQDAYTERGVTTPLTYSAINNRTTSALMGVKFKHALTPKANLIGSLGVEQDLHHKTDRLTATGIAGLTSENLSSDLHRTRPVASIGATYDIAKTQRLSGEVLVQQLPFQSTAGATAYFNYMIWF